MANVKITELFATTNPASTDVLVVVDLPADVTKKVTIADLLENAGNGSQTAPAFAFSSDSNTGIFLDAADRLGISTNGVGRIYIAADGKVGIGTSAPSEVLDVVGNAEISGTLDVTGATTFDGNLTVEGNLTVNGTTTTIDSTTLVVEDKNIELGVVATPTDGTADGGGITLKGTTDKTIRWTNSTGYWNFGQPVNVPAGTESAPGFILDNQTAGIYSPAADELGIVTDGGERIRIDFSGNVGIGTNNPTELLHLKESTPAILFQRSSESVADSFVVRNNSGGFEIRTDSTRFIHLDPIEDSVGIGTAFPVSKLHVDGGITVKDNEDVNTSLGDLSITVDKLGNSSTKSIKFLNGTSEKLRIDGNGNVGIGTSSPAKPLHAKSAVDEILRLETPDNQTGNIYQSFHDSTGELARVGMFNSMQELRLNNLQSDGEVTFRTNNAERMRIDSSGNVGIGAGAPEEKLHIAASNSAIGSNWSNANNLILIEDTDSSQSNGQVTGGIIFEGNDSDAPGIQAGIIAQAASGTGGGDLAFHTAASGSTLDGTESPRMVIHNDGNVGIGTGSPVSTLHLHNASSDGFDALRFTNTDTGITATDGFVIGLNDSEEGKIWNYDNRSIQFGVDNELHGTLRQDGRWCLGPDQVSGSTTLNVFIASGSSAQFRADSDPGIELKDDSDSSIVEIRHDSAQMVIDLDLTNQVTGESFVIKRDGTSANETELFRIDSSGNVGLGTDTPDEKLHVNGGHIVIGQSSGATTNIRNYVKFGREDNPKAAIGFINNDSNGRGDIIFMNDSVGDGTTFSNTDEVMRIDFNGNVGIGTNSPQDKLQVQDGRISIASTATEDSDIVLGTLMFRNGSSNNKNAKINAYLEGGSSGAGLRFYTRTQADGTNDDGGSERMRIDSIGNVGIGTDAPALELDVSGTVRASTGVLFGTDTADANTLDDYEEGSWTPTYEGSTSDPTVTYDQQIGSYVKIGKLVRCEGRIRTDAVSGGSGNLRISGLPFPAMNETNARGSLVPTSTSAWGSNVPTQGRPKNNASYVDLLRMTSTSVSSNMSVSDLDDGANKNDMHFAITYRAKT